MMNMEWSILPGYAREEEIRELFTEYTMIFVKRHENPLDQAIFS